MNSYRRQHYSLCHGGVVKINSGFIYFFLFQAAVLPSSAASPAVFNRNHILVRVAEVKRCNWWPAKILSVIQLAVMALFLICFVSDHLST